MKTRNTGSFGSLFYCLILLVFASTGCNTSVGPTPRSDILLSMRIVEPPDKTVYLVGEPFDATGIEVEGSYANGKTQSIPVENLIFGGFDSSRRASNQVVTVTYGGLTESFEVTIE